MVQFSGAGSKPGKLADIVVLSDDPHTVNKEKNQGY
jgi:imidazolonepropionase-like amidohydrolase